MRLPINNQISPEMGPTTDYNEVDFVLTEYQKIFIILVAALLFLLSVIITVCVVSPVCLFNRLLFGRCKRHSVDVKGKQRLVIGESKHFQLKVVPLYGSNIEKSTFQWCSGSHVTSSTRSQINKHSITHVVDDSLVKLVLKVDSVINCKPREYGLEPSVYVSIDIIIVNGLRVKRRSNLAKVSASFRTNTAKRSVEPEFGESFTSQEVPKSVMKDGRLRIKVMDDERYANDCCLGELTIPLKQFDLNSPMAITSYQLKPPKETKGDLTLGLCYLPTARRVTILVNKASLLSQSHNINYYIRALMFVNGKLMKKKKTSTSQKLTWTEKDALTFDLAQGNPEETAFLVVLSSSTDPITASLSSPSSPDSPEIPSGSRKDRHIGHTVIGQPIWREMKHQPRKQINKVLKLL
uniref:C2 domain-containing protein n=1 Tax=Tetranychus urticae TaxID=32264 RepID=T1K2B8_TETUR